MVGTADSVLIREVSLIQSVLYREVPLYILYIRTYFSLEGNFHAVAKGGMHVMYVCI